MSTVNWNHHRASVGVRWAGVLVLAVFSLRADDRVIACAIELEKAGNPTEALSLLATHLTQHPDDNEARIRYGIILSWEKQRGEARTQLETVLASNPTNYDALVALINVELWTAHPARAEELANRGLGAHPNDSDLLLLLARAQKAQLRTADAKASVKRVLAISPDRRDALSLKEGLDDDSRLWEGSISSTQEWFKDGRARWSEWQGAISAHT